MLFSIALGLAVLTGLALVLNHTVAFRFRRYCSAYAARPRPENSALPPVAVVLSLRGADFTLKDCLRGLIEQDYPDYCVQVIVDSDQDPASRIVQDVITQTGTDRVRCATLRNPLKTCSLKCSSLIQAVQSLEPRYEYVALIDCDVVPHPAWLRTLTAPLADDHVGASMGNRWYARPDGDIANWCLTTWNALIVAMMQCFGVAWGGSLAIRRSRLHEFGILDRWRYSLNDDVMLGQIVRSRGLELRFIPDLLMVNSGRTTLPGLTRFITRQLLHVRLSHTQTLVMNSIGYITTLSGVGLVIHGLVCCACAAWMPAACVAATIAAYIAGMVLLFSLLEREALRALRSRGEAFSTLGWRAWLGVTVASGVHLLGLSQALLARRMHWRGVTYSIAGKNRVTLDHYQPSPALAEVVARP